MPAPAIGSAGLALRKCLFRTANYGCHHRSEMPLGDQGAKRQSRFSSGSDRLSKVKLSHPKPALA